MRRQQEREQRRREQEEKRRIEEMDRRRKEEEERRRAEDEKRRNDREQVSFKIIFFNLDFLKPIDQRYAKNSYYYFLQWTGSLSDFRSALPNFTHENKPHYYTVVNTLLKCLRKIENIIIPETSGLFIKSHMQAARW